MPDSLSQALQDPLHGMAAEWAIQEARVHHGWLQAHRVHKCAKLDWLPNHFSMIGVCVSKWATGGGWGPKELPTRSQPI